jgi:hypothetical protein
MLQCSSRLLQIQILNGIPHSPEAQYKRYAIQGLQNAIAFRHLYTKVKTPQRNKLVRWETQLCHVNSSGTSPRILLPNGPAIGHTEQMLG